MTVPDLDPINGIWNNDLVAPAPMWSPYTPAWWSTSMATKVPETAVGYLVAQGWQIVRAYTEDDINYYDLARQSMQNWMILQTLLDSYTFAYNEGRAHNFIRYDDLVKNWNRMLVATRGTLNTIRDVSDGHVSLFLTQIDTLLADLETDVGDIKGELDGVSDDIDAQLALYLSKLETLDGQFTTHRSTSRDLLVGLGTTETARINEQWDNELAKAYQGLVNRGLYSSVLYAQLEARIERERSEALTKWNDQLAREKNENEHTLYKEQMATDEAVLGGRVRYIAQLMAKVGVQDKKHQLVLSLMQARMEKANARLGVRDREEKLMAYQLDTRNNIAIAMHQQVNAREDSYPDMSSVAKLVSGLGDAGGGWLQP
jgi:hypothetical protein